MTKKQIKILIITFIIIVLIVFIVFLLTSGGDNINNNFISNFVSEPVEVNLENNNKVDPKIIAEPIIEEKEVDKTEINIKNIAKNFAERYGTWSTHNKDENFKSAEIYATSRMKRIIENFVSDNEKLRDDYEKYYGLTAKALSVKILDSNETNANLNVSVQQTETSGENLAQKTSYQNLYLELIKSGDSWLVDYAEWDK